MSDGDTTTAAAKRHKHTFHALWATFGPYGRRQAVHYHPCWDEDCDRVLVGSGHNCDGNPATHRRETL